MCHMPFPRATPMSEVTFQRGRGGARGAVYESRSVRYRPRYIGRSTARRVGGAGSRSWWLHRRLRVENAAASRLLELETTVDTRTLAALMLFNRSLRVRLSRSRWTRSTRASSIVFSDEKRRAHRERSETSSCRTR